MRTSTTPRDLLCLALTVGLATAGCGKKNDKAPAGQTGSAGTAAGSATAGSGAATAGSGAAAGSGDAAEAPLPPVVEVDAAAVQKALDAWLAAQNAGDFAAYQALYADKMEGVKRVGPRTWRFDRKGWLADRERMFKHPMTVAMRDVKIEGSSQAPVVELVQSFKQGKFADEGTKRMVLAKTGAGLRIAREEMLQSVVAGAVAGTTAGEAWLAIELEKKPYVVIDIDASDDWGNGRLRGPFTDEFSYAMRDASKAPAAAGWATRALTVYDAGGKTCPATVGAQVLVAGGTPHFGEVQTWDGIDGGKPWSKAERARAIYDMSSPKLLGELKIDGDCKPVLVTDATRKVTQYAPAATDDALDDAATAAFRKLPAYAAIQKDFVDNYDGQGKWVDEPTVAGFTDGARRFLVVSAKEGNGCGEFSGALTAVYEDKGGKPVLLSGPDLGYLDVAAIVDLDGDGTIELVGDPEDFSTVTALYEGGPSGFSAASAVEFPFNDCGC